MVCKIDTTIRVKEQTYRAIVKTRGAFEQTFGRKLTLDDAMFLAASYINIAYEEFQGLLREGLLEIVIEKDGSYGVRLMNLDKIAQIILPRVVTAFENVQGMLKRKEQKIPVFEEREMPNNETQYVLIV